MKRLMITLISILAIVSSGWSLPKVDDVLKTMDANNDFPSYDLSCKANFTQVKDKETKVTESVFYRRDADDSMLIITTAPEVDKGNGYLKIGDNWFFYLANTGSFQQVNRDETINGTDVKAGDEEKVKYEDLYKPEADSNGNEMISEDTLANIPVYKIVLINKINDVTYPKKILWVDRDKYLVYKAEDYSLNDTLMQTELKAKYFEKDGHYFPLLQKYEDDFEVGNLTLLQVSELSFDPLNSSIFTKAYLKNLGK